jgi:hypothetical protein
MTPTPQTPLDAALDYYDRGLMPIPVHRVIAHREGKPICSCGARDGCASPGKHPTMTWSQFQKRRPPREEVADWWSGDRARYGVGILTGSASGNIFVLDVDVGPGKDGDDSLRALQMTHGDLPETAEVRTGGGGLHLYFRAPPGVAVVRNSASKLGPGLDIRGEGGFVVAPPSMHASGQPYVWSWTNTLAEGIADAPAWLLDLVRAESAIGATPRDRVASSPPVASPVGAGSLGVLPPAVEDGREEYMRDTVFAVALELTGENGAWPTAEEVYEVAWPQFLRRVDLSRPGRITRDNAEQEMRAKCNQIAAKAESGGMGALEDVVASYQAKRREQPRQGPGNRQEEAAGASRQEQAETPRPPTHFPLVYADEIHAGDAALDFVEGLLVEGGMSVWYGDSNVGKTFALLDVAIHVALGRPWRGREVDQGAVVYCALEGIAGIRNRIAAWLKHYGITPDRRALPLVVIPSAINMLDPQADVPGLIQSVQAAEAELGRPVKMLCLDTLSRALAGGNENSPEDMGALVRSSDLVRQSTGSHLAYVHHSGKDTAKGARGHSLLRAATDTEIEISRAEGSEVSVMRVTKQRELESGDDVAFRLEVVTLGVNRRGKPLTSCVAVEPPVEAVEAATRKVARPRGTYQPGMLRVLTNILASDAAVAVAPKPGMPTLRCVRVKIWQEHCYQDGVLERGVRASVDGFSDGKRALSNAGLIGMTEEFAWLP